MSVERLVFNSSAASGVAALRSKDPKLIIRVITFELVQPICPHALRSKNVLKLNNKQN